MKLTEFIKSLAKKAGIPDTDANLTAIAGNTSLADVEIANETANIINGNLYTADAAENNPAIRKKLVDIGRAEIFNGLDAEINSTMDELGLADDVKTVILAEKSSTKRAALLAKKVKEIEGTTKGTDKNELTKQVNDLNSKIATMQREHETALKSKDTELAEKMLQKDIDTDLTGFNYIFPKETPLPTKLAAARASINTKLAAKGLKVVTDAAGNKKLVRSDGTDYFDETNKPVSYHDFLSGALAQDNLLLVTDPNNQGDGDKTTPPKVYGNQNGNGVNHNLLSQADTALADLEASMKLNPL